ncbi:unannotated protein [freshwater metagenome]|uniref:Unannotated protein n=1 Tax=freshwater metagenome TaxID=449393 RepID=A0A6J7SIN8_9ZZZZ
MHGLRFDLDSPLLGELLGRRKVESGVEPEVVRREVVRHKPLTSETLTSETVNRELMADRAVADIRFHSDPLPLTQCLGSTTFQPF